MSKFQIDSLDKKILSFLMKNARTPFIEIARECGISGAAVHQRVQKLEDAGIIENSKFIINPKSLGYETRAYIGLFLERASMYNDVKDGLKEIPEIVECHFMTGNYGILVKVYCKDNDHLKDLLLNIHDIPGVINTDTFISIEQFFERQVQL